MIWSWIITLIVSILSYLIGLLPTVSNTSGFGSAFAVAGHYMAVPYQFIPYITITIIAIVAFDVAFESGYLFFKIIYWIIKRFPTQS